MSRPTPETDAKASPHIGFYSCATVPANFARALEQERDEARDALSRIDEIFCDGEDTHDDWMKMGSIAKDYFKGLE